VILASGQKAWLVLFVAISVPGKTPAVFVSEVTNPAKMQGRISYPMEPMIARLPPEAADCRVAHPVRCRRRCS
jgi:hypothetical protein